MTEFGAAAAVGTVAGANGKNVSEGLTAVLGKVGEQTVKAASREEKPSPALKLGPGQVKDSGGVPLPPAPSGRRAAQPSLPSIAEIRIPEQASHLQTIAEVAPTLPPPPEMSRETLHEVTPGMTRADLLRFGAPASKITMDEDGRMVEIYSYRQNSEKIGTVRLQNGAVSSVQ
jgi:hypothetical protein